ncbi:MAG TPA: efflux RND transporter periplasmic adaptor subunit [Planctomycetes bacterium]|nr:efflux RND transporter periplasmic adaptor subunit [Planctomycetota bacterium]HIK60677.1 efflux RND transporter periplasmic adaptor subunit [Planctomycetota bacterium]
MDSVKSDIDLEALARPRSGINPPKRSALRWLVPALLLLGFAGVLATTLQDYFAPVVEVSIIRPQSSVGGEAGAVSVGQVVLQAAGWVEPDPFPIQVPTLAPGTVRQMLVEESDKVSAGDPVARLVDEDARIAQDEAEAVLEVRQAELVESGIIIGRERLEEGIETKLAVATSEATLNGAKAAAEIQAAAEVEGSEQLKLAESTLRVQFDLEIAGATSPWQVENAQSGVLQARAKLDGLKAQTALAQASMAAAQAVNDRAASDVRLLFKDRLDLARTRSKRATAEVQTARARLQEASLRLERMIVRAPVDGVVLARLAVPGMTLNGGSVCTLYDPNSLRVRVDVPQADVSGLQIGQRVEILSESRKGQPYQGEVLRVVQRADIQKVTLQVHVRVNDEDELLRPEMLVQARFFGTGDALDPSLSPEASNLVLIPTRVLVGETAWVVDGTTGLAAKRTLTLGNVRGDHTEVLSGLNISDKVVDQGHQQLAEGDRIVIRKKSTQ